MRMVKLYQIEMPLGGIKQVRLSFPTAEMRRSFLDEYRHVGAHAHPNKPVTGGLCNLQTTYSDLCVYAEIRGFLPVWDSNWTNETAY